LEIFRLSVGSGDALQDGSVERYTDLTKPLIGGLSLMHSLQEQTLTFHGQDSSLLMSELANSVYFPKIVHISLLGPVCAISSVSQFLCKHAGTLIKFGLGSMMALDGDAEQKYRDFLTKLHHQLKLNAILLGSLMDVDDGHFVFPDIDRTEVKEQPNDDGYIEVSVNPFLNFDGLAQVKNGLARMLSCMVRGQ
jgi:hypothetical protein